jgi:hypothetical protein
MIPTMSTKTTNVNNFGEMKFVQISKNLQDACSTPEDAKRAFATSCNICCSRGIKMDCDRCPVKAHHELVVAVMADLEEFDMKKSQQL